MRIQQQAIERDGFAILPAVLAPEGVTALVSDLERALPRGGASVLASRDQVYGVRNLVEVWPAAREAASDVAKRVAVADMLGSGFGLVRDLLRQATGAELVTAVASGPDDRGPRRT